MADIEKNAVTKRGARNKAFTWFFLILILIGLSVTAYWCVYLKDYERTDDAYVSGNQVMISAQISGNIKRINAENMTFVQAGDLLLELDATEYQLAFEQAQSNLATTVRQLSQLNHTIKQLHATVQARNISLARAKGDLVRREKLYQTHAIDKESYQHAKDAVMLAQADLDAAQHQLAANQALLSDTPLHQQPEVKKAVSAMKKAWLDLQRTKILSPIDGYVARRSAQVGQKVAAGSPLLAVISTQQMWVEANFKETQLRNMRIGQAVRLTFDLYGDNLKFDGKIAGIEMGTGSAFSLLPAQNATGNWIKVVQRVPVRIALAEQQLVRHPLRIGLSALAEVDISDNSGAVLNEYKPLTTLYQTDTLDYDQSAVENLAEIIIRQNSD